jgi:hypothetical protein
MPLLILEFKTLFVSLLHTDSQVSTFRRWLDAFGGSVPTCSAEDMKAMGRPLPKEQVVCMCWSICDNL